MDSTTQDRAARGPRTLTAGGPVRFGGALVGLALALGGIIVAPAAASATEDASPVSVQARMHADTTALGTGSIVTVDLLLANRGSTVQRVRLDEVVGGLLDDAELAGAVRSSDGAISVTRIGRDRFALAGELRPDASVSISYGVVVGDPTDRGDGLLSRSIVGADVDAPTCASTVDAPNGRGIDACTALVLPGISMPSAQSADRVEEAAAAATSEPIAAEVSRGDLVAAGVGTGTVAATDAADGPAVPLPVVVVVSSVLALILGSLLVRARRGTVEPVVARGARPWPAPTTVVTVPRHAAPVGPAPILETRRERRLAERRLAERGLALPVA